MQRCASIVTGETGKEFIGGCWMLVFISPTFGLSFWPFALLKH